MADIWPVEDKLNIMEEDVETRNNKLNIPELALYMATGTMYVHFIFYLSQKKGTHCSKSSIFVQRFNFDFPKKWSIFLCVKNS